MQTIERKRVRIPLYVRILGWFALNLVFVGVCALLLFRFQFQVGLESVLLGRAADRMASLVALLRFELNRTPPAEWDETLARFGEAHQMTLLLFRADGTQVAGESVELPAAVRQRLAAPRGGPGGRAEGWWRRGPPPGPTEGQDFPLEGRRSGRGLGGSGPGLALVPFFLRTDHPTRYWVGVRLPLRDRENLRGGPVVLIGVASTLYGRLFDPLPWLAAGCGVLALSALFWIPLVRGMTRSMAQITAATKRVAEGDFAARVPEERGDELGRLAEGVNRMAARLAGFVTGQKRFLGDVAHELCAPLARLQMTLALLEQRAGVDQRPHLEDLREELDQMSGLVNELMTFSKAGLRPADARLEPVALRDLAIRVTAREVPSGRRLDLQIPADLRVSADPDLLARALGNILRNANRHAPEGGITVSAERSGERVCLHIRDEGPGVPEDALEKIFDPFYRVDDSRTRDTGGAGLGLAIVKTCVEACRGRVHARNVAPRGLEVVMDFSTGD